MKLTAQEKNKILVIVNNPQLTFEETKQSLVAILPNANEQQIEALTKVICEAIGQSKRGQFSGITDLE
ncbi:5847_t:CDS:1, partial [Funneliformis geosporum]